MKKILALLLVFVMLFSVAALITGCDDGNKKGSSSNEEEDKDDETTAPEATDPAPTDPVEEEYKKITTFSMNLNGQSLDAMDNGDGTAFIMIATDSMAYGNLDVSCLDTISKALAGTDYEALAVPAEEDWAGAATLQVSFGEEDFFSFESYHSETPAEFIAIFDVMHTCFKELATQLPELEPQIMGEIADSDKAAIDGILENLDLWKNADQFIITGTTASAEEFSWITGLNSAEGVISGLKFSEGMSSVPFSVQLVTVEDGMAETVAARYEESIDWQVFGCVFPDYALIATNGNQVLMLLGKDDEFAQTYSMTAAAIEAAGWTTYSIVTNPDIQ